MRPGLIVGVDIGGTKTQIRIEGAGVERERIVSTQTWRNRDNLQNAGDLLALIETELAGEVPLAIGVGAHGCDTAEDCGEFQAALQTLARAPVRVVNDAELMVPALGIEHGIGVVSGTGSIAVARRADGTMLVAGGWGWILGDEGSAPGLVREAAKAIRNRVDLGLPNDGLYDALCASLGARNFSYFGRRLEKLQDATDWGRHAGAIFEAAEAGSAQAVDVIRQGVQGLTLLVRRLVDRGADFMDVVVGGGVAAAQPLLCALFEEELARALPGRRLSLLREPPVAGAVVIARRLLALQPADSSGMAP